MGWTQMDNEEAMVWVETSLRYARNRNLPKVVGLLVVVRDEIVLETEIARCASLTHWRTGAR
ncbi:MAG TPA: hypothetical protein VE194_07075 [Rubrobacter sp.]|nr:hypothetical protein [Rubrobacter sp.]